MHSRILCARMRASSMLETFRRAARRAAAQSMTHPITSGAFAAVLGSAIALWLGIVPGPLPGPDGPQPLSEPEYVQRVQSIERDLCGAEQQLMDAMLGAYQRGFAMRADQGAPPREAGDAVIAGLVGEALPAHGLRLDALTDRLAELVPPERWQGDHAQHLGMRRAELAAYEDLLEVVRDNVVGAQAATVEDVLDPLASGAERLELSPEYAALLEVRACEARAERDAEVRDLTAQLGQLVFVDPRFGSGADAAGAPLGRTFGPGALLPLCRGDTLYAWVESLLPFDQPLVAGWSLEDPGGDLTPLIGGELVADPDLALFVAPVTVPADDATLVFRLDVGFDYLEWVVFSECP